MAASNEEELYRLTCVLERIQEYGFHLRPEKYALFLASTKYLGFVFDNLNRCLDPEIHLWM